MLRYCEKFVELSPQKEMNYVAGDRVSIVGTCLPFFGLKKAGSVLADKLELTNILEKANVR